MTDPRRVLSLHGAHERRKGGVGVNRLLPRLGEQREPLRIRSAPNSAESVPVELLGKSYL
jgi:hypothetical protein